MKVIFVAKNVLAAYLMSSLVSISVNTIGVSLKKSGRYNSRITSFARSLFTPITTLSGRMKSFIAAPSLKNSGFELTSNSASGRSSLMVASTCLPVPTGTVDLVTTSVYPFKASAISFAALNT